MNCGRSILKALAATEYCKYCASRTCPLQRILNIVIVPWPVAL